MAKKTNPTDPVPPAADAAALYHGTAEGPLLVVGKVLRRTKREVPRPGGEILTLVTYEIQGLNGEVTRVTQAGVEDCLGLGAVVTIPVYVSAYTGKAGPVWSLWRKQASGTEF
jgi:hypothetical protein